MGQEYGTYIYYDDQCRAKGAEIYEDVFYSFDAKRVISALRLDLPDKTRMVRVEPYDRSKECLVLQKNDENTWEMWFEN